MSKLDVILAHTTHSPEPRVAAWIELELRAYGLKVETRVCKSMSGQQLEAFYGEASYVAVLLSSASVQSSGLAFLEVHSRGRKPLPISIDDHPKHALMVDLSHALITGKKSAANRAQLERVVAAVRG